MRTVLYYFTLFVIFRSRYDIEGSVYPLEEHNPKKLVREGHLGDRKPHIAHTLDLVRKSVGASDNKAYLTVCVRYPLKLLGKFFRGELLPLNTHSYLIGAL